jgi:hypothetical protein
MYTTHPFPTTVNAARHILANAYDTVRAHARRIEGAARRTLDRVGTAAESYVGDRIKRRVKPPIVAALLAAGVAVVVSIVALVRK